MHIHDKGHSDPACGAQMSRKNCDMSGTCQPEMAASHFLQVQVKSQVISLQVQVKSQVISLQVQVKSQVISLQVQVKSQVIWSDVKSSHKSFGPNTSQVTSLFVQVQVKSHIILSSCNTQSGPGIKSIYSELQSKI